MRGSASAPRWASPLASSAGTGVQTRPGPWRREGGRLSPDTPPSNRRDVPAGDDAMGSRRDRLWGVVRPPRGGPRGRPRRVARRRVPSVGVRPCGHRRRRSAHGSRSRGSTMTIVPSDRFSRTLVIEKPQGFQRRSRDSSGFRFSITVLECDYSIQPIRDEFRGGKSRWKWGHGPSSLIFLRCYRNPDRTASVSTSPHPLGIPRSGGQSSAGSHISSASRGGQSCKRRIGILTDVRRHLNNQERADHGDEGEAAGQRPRLRRPRKRVPRRAGRSRQVNSSQYLLVSLQTRIAGGSLSATMTRGRSR